MNPNRIQQIRKIHLYLGCIFAPMIVFFAVTGVMQMAKLHYNDKSDSKIVTLVSTVHMDRGIVWKDGTAYDWSSPAMKVFVFAMAGGMILTTILGVVMAFKFGKSRAALWSLFAGVAIPVLLICLRHRP